MPLLRQLEKFDRMDRSASVQLSLVLLLVSVPVLDAAPVGKLVLHGMVSLLAVSLLQVSGRSRRALAVTAILVVPAIVMQWLAVRRDSPIQLAVYAGLFSCLLFFGAWRVYRMLMRSRRVDQTTLRQAATVYLLLGLAWCYLYMLVAAIDMRAFHNSPADEPVAAGDFAQLLYFSFVTLTTLGYGDILPQQPVARTLAWLEAVTGQLYIAFAIARFVGLYIARETAARPEAPDGGDADERSGRRPPHG